MQEYNEALANKTGHTISEIAAHAVGMKPKDLLYDPGLIAVLPMTCGSGIIKGFAETVAGILKFLGMRTFVPSSSDAKGFAEALENKAEIIFMADDDQFIAAHLKTGLISDNSRATGRGYIGALDYLTAKLKDRDVLILGAGPVGCSAAFSVLDFGGNLYIYDKDPRVSEKLAHEILNRRGKFVHIEKNLDSALRNHRTIVDACPEGGFITKDYLHLDSYIAAPGLPLGIDTEGLDQIRPRLIHDPLQLGVATMIHEILKGIKEKS